MSTRGIVVIKTKDKQFGILNGSDSYPSGLGTDILTLLDLKHGFIGRMEENLGKIRFITNSDIDNKCYELAGGKTAYESLPHFDNRRYRIQDEAYEYFNVMFGGYDILESLFDGDEITMIDELNFAGDSLMCEWGYVIDLEKRLFEVYEGFNETALSPNDRFYWLQNDDKKYKPIRIVAVFSLDSLPSEREFNQAVYGKDDGGDSESNNETVITLTKYINNDLKETKEFDSRKDAESWIRQEINAFYESGEIKIEIYNDHHMILLLNRLTP